LVCFPSSLQDRSKTVERTRTFSSQTKLTVVVIPRNVLLFVAGKKRNSKFCFGKSCHNFLPANKTKHSLLCNTVLSASLSIQNQLKITMVAPMDYKTVTDVIVCWEKVRRIPNYLDIVGPQLFSKYVQYIVIGHCAFYAVNVVITHRDQRSSLVSSFILIHTDSLPRTKEP
jgi:hypothetical protein